MDNLKRRIKFAGRIVKGRIAGKRRFILRPDDLFLISYPKSGNTWTRFLTANLKFIDERVDFETIERQVPDLYTNDEIKLGKIASPRILKSHDAYQPMYRRVLYIVRDPRDVLVSYYHHQIKTRRITADTPMQDFVDTFIAGEIDSYGSWGENVGSWIGAREGSPGFKLIRYEDLHAKPIETLGKVAKFLDLSADEDKLQKVYDSCRAEQMMKLEIGSEGKLSILKNTDQNKRFVRNAKVGGWQDELPMDSAVRIQQHWGELMIRLGYESV